MSRLIGLFLLVAIAFTAAAQVDQEGMFRLDEKDFAEGKESDATKVISASRSEKYIADLPVTVYVITGEEIRQNGYSTLADVLKAIPGIQVTQPGSAIDGEMFVIRGLYGNYYTKILLDNIPVQPSVVSGMPIGDQLPVRQAERIEIILGPVSSMYASDAMTGVINIVTRTSERPVIADADITIGTSRYYALNAFIGGKAVKGRNVMKYSFYGNATRQGDMNVKYDIPDLYDPSIYDSTYQFLQEPFYRGDSSNPVMNDLPRESNLLGIRMNFRSVNIGYDIMQRQVHSSFGQNTAAYSYADPTAFWGETINRAFMRYDHSWKKANSITQVSYLRYRLNNQSSFTMNNAGTPTGKTFKYAASDDIFFDQELTYAPVRKLELVAGVSFQYSGNLPKTNDLSEPFNKDDYRAFSEEEIPGTDPFGSFGFHPLTFINLGGFVQVFYTTGKLTALVSDRYDYHSIYGGTNNPRISFLYAIKENMTLRALYGQGLRVPSTCYTYNSLAFVRDSGIYYQIIPNPDLKPEKLHTAEIGYRFESASGLAIDLVAYYQQMRDYISLSLLYLDPEKYPDAVNPSGITTAYKNDENSEFRLAGGQAGLSLKEIVPSIHLAADLSVSAAIGKEVLPGNLGTLDDVRSYPRYMARLDISLRPVQRLYITLNNTLCSKSAKRFLPLEPEIMEQLGLPVYVEGYYLLDLIVRIDITRQLQAYFNVNNLFGSAYGGIDAYGYPTDLLYNPQYGRNIHFGLSFRLN